MERPVAIGKIRKLYAIEKRIEKLPPEEKTRQRQQLAQPVLDDQRGAPPAGTA